MCSGVLYSKVAIFQVSSHPPYLFIWQDINQLTQYFKQDCESMQGQQDLGATGKIDYLLFDENGVIEKIKKMIYAKKREEEKIFILQELQNEVF